MTMGDRVPEQRAQVYNFRPILPRVKLYNLRVAGPSTEGDEATARGLTLDSVVTALLMLQVGDSATVDCVEETTDWGMFT